MLLFGSQSQRLCYLHPNPSRRRPNNSNGPNLKLDGVLLLSRLSIGFGADQLGVASPQQGLIFPMHFCGLGSVGHYFFRERPEMKRPSPRRPARSAAFSLLMPTQVGICV